MDPDVLRAMARWPDVPAVFGWLALDRRGNWLLKDAAGGGYGRIGNPALREFIGRNYAADHTGRWYFQNGPQRVYVALAYTPWVLHYEGETLVDHCGRATSARATYADEEGSILVLGERGLGLLDDDVPVVEYAPNKSGTYWIRPTMVACSVNPCGYGIVVFVK